MQPLNESEGMVDAPPNHWTENLGFRVFLARRFWAYARLDLRTPNRRGTKERGMMEGGKDWRSGKHESRGSRGTKDKRADNRRKHLKKIEPENSMYHG